MQVQRLWNPIRQLVWLYTSTVNANVHIISFRFVQQMATQPRTGCSWIYARCTLGIVIRKKVSNVHEWETTKPNTKTFNDFLYGHLAYTEYWLKFGHFRTFQNRNFGVCAFGWKKTLGLQFSAQIKRFRPKGQHPKFHAFLKESDKGQTNGWRIYQSN